MKLPRIVLQVPSYDKIKNKKILKNNKKLDCIFNQAIIEYPQKLDMSIWLENIELKLSWK